MRFLPSMSAKRKRARVGIHRGVRLQPVIPAKGLPSTRSEAGFEALRSASMRLRHGSPLAPRQDRDGPRGWQSRFFTDNRLHGHAQMPSTERACSSNAARTGAADSAGPLEGKLRNQELHLSAMYEKSLYFLDKELPKLDMIATLSLRKEVHPLFDTHELSLDLKG